MLQDVFVSCLGHTVTLRSVILCPKQLANTSRCLWTEFCGDKYDISAYIDLRLASAGLRITAFIYFSRFRRLRRRSTSKS